MMPRGEREASLAAISICACEGMIPWMTHDIVSRILALLRLVHPVTVADVVKHNGPTVMMANVLLAVQKLAMLTKVAMQSSAPRLLLTCLVSFDNIVHLAVKADQPAYRLAIRVMMMSSPIPVIPVPMEPSQSSKADTACEQADHSPWGDAQYQYEC